MLLLEDAELLSVLAHMLCVSDMKGPFCWEIVIKGDREVLRAVPLGGQQRHLWWLPEVNLPHCQSGSGGHNTPDETVHEDLDARSPSKP